MEDSFKQLVIADTHGENALVEVGLLSLPAELLDRIVNHLVDVPDELEFTFTSTQLRKFTCIQDEAQPWIRTVHGLRLVCKRLCDAASRACMPLLRIRLSEASLARAEEILSYPRLSDNIRGVELLLSYCPDSMASDFDTFWTLKVDALSSLHGDWENVDAQVIRGGYYNWTREALENEANRILDSDIRGMPLDEFLTIDSYRPLHKYNVLALHMWRTIRDAWQEERNQTANRYKQDDPKRKLLMEGFRRFQAINKEQHKLVASGEFARRVAAICSCLPSFRSLLIRDREVYDAASSQDSWTDAGARIMFDDDAMLEYLSRAPPWCIATEAGDIIPTTVPATRLIWDVPMAISLHPGVTLRRLRLTCFPTAAQNRDSSQHGSDNEGRCDEDEALAHLESFSFTIRGVSKPGGYGNADLPYGDQTPDAVISSTDAHLFGYIARRIARSPRLRSFRLVLPASVLRSSSSTFLYYEDRRKGMRQPYGLSGMRDAGWLKREDVDVAMWAYEAAATLVWQSLQKLPEHQAKNT